MNKQQFLAALREKLNSMPLGDVNKRLDYYSEMIDDRIEDGMSEADAVDALGSVESIADQILNDGIPASVSDRKDEELQTEPEATVKKRISGLGIFLIVLGIPLWLPLLISFAAVIISLYVSLWAIIISLWAVFASFAGCSLGGIAAGIGFMLGGKGLIGLALLSSGIALAGLSVLTFYGCKGITALTIFLTKKIAVWIKKHFMKRGERNG